MLIRILGSAAGGGFPQWNCGCSGCRAVREAATDVYSRYQSSVAVRTATTGWFLVNASPDVRQQLEWLWDGPPAIRSSPFAGVLLTDAEIDHTAGLLLLRESAEPLCVYGTKAVQRALSEGLGLLPTLEDYCGVEWSVLEPNVTFNLAPGKVPGLEVEVFQLPGKPPKYMRQKADRGVWEVGLTFRDLANGKVVTYAPGLAELDEQVLQRFESSDCILVDGTFWRNDELLVLGISTQTARMMGHLPLSDVDGSLQRLAKLSRPRKILIHINNTNPILLKGSPERQAVEAAGVEVGYDGQTIEL